MSKSLKWTIAAIVAVTASSIAGVWLEGATATTVQGVLSAIGIACGITGFVIWFRGTQR